MSVAPQPPAGLVDLPAFKKPIPTVPTPLIAFDPAYVERRKQITEQILQLKNGRQLAFFTEGSPADPAVLCLHSLGQSKLEWIMRKPLPGVYLIAVDRQGHGNSSPYPPGLPPSTPARKFSDDADEYVELLDSLGVNEFRVTGSSMGGCFTIALAALFPERCVGCAPVSGLADPWHSSVTTDAERKALCAEGSMALLTLADSGCKSWMMRKVMLAVFSTASKDKSVDPGFAKQYPTYFKFNQRHNHKTYGPDFALMDSDPYLVSQLLDAHNYGLNCAHGGLGAHPLLRPAGMGLRPHQHQEPLLHLSRHLGRRDADRVPRAQPQDHPRRAACPGEQQRALDDPAPQGGDRPGPRAGQACCDREFER